MQNDINYLIQAQNEEIKKKFKQNNQDDFFLLDMQCTNKMETS